MGKEARKCREVFMELKLADRLFRRLLDDRIWGGEQLVSPS